MARRRQGLGRGLAAVAPGRPIGFRFSSAIPVQPTAVARRRQGLGRGLAAVVPGRPIGFRFSSAIPVQPTAVARRRQGLGIGLAAVVPGRPIGFRFSSAIPVQANSCGKTTARFGDRSSSCSTRTADWPEEDIGAFRSAITPLQRRDVGQLHTISPTV